MKWRIGLQKMAQIDVKHIHRVKKKLKSGETTEYHYAWRGGPRFYSSTDGFTVNGPEYWAAYNKIIADLTPAQGYFRQIILAYMKSPEFTNLAKRSQKDMRVSVAHPMGIDARFGTAPIKAFDDARIRQHAYKWRDELAESSARVADMRLTHLTTIVSWAVDRGLLTKHNLMQIKKLYKSKRAEIYWTEAEVEQLCAVAPPYVQNILKVAIETGLRPGDLRNLNRSHLKKTDFGYRIVMRTAKRGRVVSIPVTEALHLVLKSLPKDQFQVLVGANGVPFKSENSLGSVVSKYRNIAGIRKELRLYDARGTAATKLFKANLSLREVATFMGWSVQNAANMIETYASMHPDTNSDVLVKLKSAN